MTRFRQSHRAVASSPVVLVGLSLMIGGIILLLLWTSQIWPPAGLFLPWIFGLDACFYLAGGFGVGTTLRGALALVIVFFIVGILFTGMVSLSWFGIFRSVPT